MRPVLAPASSRRHSSRSRISRPAPSSHTDTIISPAARRQTGAKVPYAGSLAELGPRPWTTWKRRPVSSSGSMRTKRGLGDGVPREQRELDSVEQLLHPFDLHGPTLDRPRSRPRPSPGRTPSTSKATAWPSTAAASLVPSAVRKTTRSVVDDEVDREDVRVVVDGNRQPADVGGPQQGPATGLVELDDSGGKSSAHERQDRSPVGTPGQGPRSLPPGRRDRGTTGTCSAWTTSPCSRTLMPMSACDSSATQGIGRVAFIVDGEPTVLPGELHAGRGASWCSGRRRGSAFDVLVRDSRGRVRGRPGRSRLPLGLERDRPGKGGGPRGGDAGGRARRSCRCGRGGSSAAPGWIGVRLREVTGRRIVQLTAARRRSG